MAEDGHKDHGSIERIVTHDDFDGIVSAALCVRALGCEDVDFAGPRTVTSPGLSVNAADAVCDLPYPLECGMWFDHHPGNREELLLRGIDPASLPGRFEERPSCARVVYEYFTERGTVFPEFMDATVAEADRIDSFDYESVEDWRRETPGKLVDMSIKSRFASRPERDRFLRRLVPMLASASLEETAGDAEVAARTASFRDDEARMLDMVEKSSFFLDGDTGRELVVIDLTGHKKQPRVQRNLAYMIYPSALGVLSVSSVFRGGRKTNDLSLSLSLSMNLSGRDHGKDAGEIMRMLNLGDGHPGAAGGSLACASKDMMLREKERILGEIWDIWKGMPAG